MTTTKLFAALFALISFFNCQTDTRTTAQQSEIPSNAVAQTIPQDAPRELKALLDSASDQMKVTKSYDPAYVVLKYPMGDVPEETGVCTDVVIRAMRRAGVDLQKEVHEDMTANFSVYPQKWSLKRADSNIDHRRVPNLQTFFARRKKSLPVTDKAENFKPGDIVAWDLNGKGLTHIGIVSNLRSDATGRFLIIHNIGAGASAEDRLFEWKIIGHYRYF